MAEKARARVFVTGRVQGVFYRASTRAAAQERDVAGWVRNLPDGRVEAVFEGRPDAVDALIEWCHAGSERASVTDVSIECEQPKGLDGFEIRR